MQCKVVKEKRCHLRLCAERMVERHGVKVKGHSRDVCEIRADALDHYHEELEQVGDEGNGSDVPSLRRRGCA